MNTFCYLFIFAFEQFVSLLYFNNKFEPKVKSGYMFLCFSLSFLTQFLINLVNIPELNLLTFLVCNIIIVFICYDATTPQCIFNVLLLEGLMIATELIMMFLISIFLGIKLTDFSKNASIILYETVATKSLYFFFAYMLSKRSSKEIKMVKDFSFILFTIPLASIFTMISFGYITVRFNIDKIVYVIYTIISFLLLFSNVIVFLVHEHVISTLAKNTELKLERQKNEINAEHYAELEHQFELANILVHDIKKHLAIINTYAEDGHIENIKHYIKSVYQSNDIQALKQFSNNKLINVIMSRYANLCKSASIEFNDDIRNLDFSFVTDSDLTALLNNLLENAYEAALKTDHGYIDIAIDERNERYISINISNSCDRVPEKVGNTYTTSKSDKKHHGYGIKSINRIAKRYDGMTHFEYDEVNNSFTTLVLLKIK